MGCGCGGRRKNAVTSVNDAELIVQQEESEEALRIAMQSLTAAVHNANSEVVVASQQ